MPCLCLVVIHLLVTWWTAAGRGQSSTRTQQSPANLGPTPLRPPANTSYHLQLSTQQNKRNRLTADIMSSHESKKRPYRSRKQKPCNNCRKRKIFCTRTNDGPCSLCEARDISCVIEGSDDSFAASRQPLDSNPAAPASHGPEASSHNDGLTSSGLCGHYVNTAEQVEVERFVGLSSDLDLFVLRHRVWPETNATPKTTWSCQRIGTDPVSPAYFTVSVA